MERGDLRSPQGILRGCIPPQSKLNTVEAMDMARAYRCEEGPVTFQVGMLASDGVLLASDMLTIEKVVNKPAALSQREKIVLRRDKGIAYCCAGDELASAVGKEIAERIDSSSYSDLAGFLSNSVEEIVARDAPVGYSSWFGGSVLLVCGSGPLELWRLNFIKQSARPPEVYRIKGRFVTTGDECNYARLYLEQYFPGHRDRKPTVADLVPLAAHTVLVAADLNPQEIQGLEIVLCTQSGFERLPEARTEILCDFSTNLIGEIKRRFGFPTRP